MLKAHRPTVPGNQIQQQPKSGRIPLKPTYSPRTPININLVTTIPKYKRECSGIEILVTKNGTNKENVPPADPHHCLAPPAPTKTKTECALDASLAEELIAIRERFQRMRIEKEKTESMLEERDQRMDVHMKELQKRGEMQKELEIELDMLYRLKELRGYSSLMRTSPIRSLRAKEQERMGNKNQSLQQQEDRMGGQSMDEGTLLWPSPEADVDV